MKLQSILRSAFIGAALSASSLLANTVDISDTPFDGGGNGGEFYAETSAHGNFYTFCLENFTHVNLPGTYNYTISDRAYAGGGDNHDPVGSGPAGDPLSKGTAWLYEQFFLGTLVDTDGVGVYADNRSYNARVLQEAFWTLEDEYNYSPNYYVSLVVSLFGATGAYETVGPDSRVQVMNLWDDNQNDVQSQLIYVPDSGMTAALLGLGLLSLAAFRRRKL